MVNGDAALLLNGGLIDDGMLQFANPDGLVVMNTSLLGMRQFFVRELVKELNGRPEVVETRCADGASYFLSARSVIT